MQALTATVSYMGHKGGGKENHLFYGEQPGMGLGMGLDSPSGEGLVTQGWLGLQGLFFMYHSLEYIIFTSCN